MSILQEILLNILFLIVGSILAPYIEKVWSQISQEYKKHYEQRKVIFSNTVQFIINNPHEEVILRIRFSHRTLAPLLFIIIGVILLASDNPFLFFFTLAINVIVIFQIYSLRKISNLIDEVNRQKIKAYPDIDLDIKIPKKKK